MEQYFDIKYKVEERKLKVKIEYSDYKHIGKKASLYVFKNMEGNTVSAKTIKEEKFILKNRHFFEFDLNTDDYTYRGQAFDINFYIEIKVGRNIITKKIEFNTKQSNLKINKNRFFSEHPILLRLLVYPIIVLLLIGIAIVSIIGMESPYIIIVGSALYFLAIGIRNIYKKIKNIADINTKNVTLGENKIFELSEMVSGTFKRAVNIIIFEVIIYNEEIDRRSERGEYGTSFKKEFNAITIFQKEFNNIQKGQSLSKLLKNNQIDYSQIYTELLPEQKFTKKSGIFLKTKVLLRKGNTIYQEKEIHIKQNSGSL